MNDQPACEDYSAPESVTEKLDREMRAMLRHLGEAYPRILAGNDRLRQVIREFDARKARDAA